MKNIVDGRLVRFRSRSGRKQVPLRWFLVRLVLLCLLPAVGVAAAFGIYQVVIQYKEINETSESIARAYRVSVTHDLDTRIRGLSMLAESPKVLADDRRVDLYDLAQAYWRNFDSHVILADPTVPMTMLFNTRVPLGEALPPLPVPQGFAAAPAAVAQKRPATGDVFFGPIAKRDLVAVVVPVLYDERVTHLLIALVETSQFQDRIGQVPLPAQWVLSLLDGQGTVVARAGGKVAPDDVAWRVELPVETSQWKVVLTIPTWAYWGPLVQSSAFLFVMVAVALIVGLAGGIVSARRLEQEASAMGTPKASRKLAPQIKEFALAASVIDSASITLERRAASLLKHDEHQRLAHRLAGVGFWEWEPDTDLFRGSPESELLVSGGSEFFEGHLEQWCVRVHQDDRQYVIDAFIRQSSISQPINLEFRVVSAESGPRWMILLGDRQSDLSDAGPLYLGVVMDITEKKHYVDSLKHVEKMQAVGQLASGVVHDFNNVLGIILGNITLLKRSESGMPSDGLHDRIDRIEQSTRRAIALTSNLLRFSRREAPTTEVVDVNEVVANLDQLLSKSLTPAIELKFRLSTDLAPVRVGPGDLGDALINLALNARDAMPDGGKITMSTEKAELDETYCRLNPDTVPGEYICVSVSDTGAGIPKDIQGRIFEPFFSTKPAGKGTGLGLAMVYGFVARSRGHITLESAPGVGSKFRIYLPKSEMPSEVEALQETLPSDMPTGREIILVVDDEPGLRELAAEILESLGYRVLKAGSAREALGFLRSDRTIDLLFSDIVLPGGMSGFDLAREGRELRPDLGIVLTSGDLQYQSNDAYSNAVEIPVLKKPYNDTDLALEIRRAIDARKASASDATTSSETVNSEQIYQWSDELRIGIDALDRDHQWLFDMVRRARDSVAAENPTPEVVAILVELRNYAETHFKREEVMMRVCEYPDLVPHQKAHAYFIERLADLEERLKTDPNSANALVGIGSEWITRHVRDEVEVFRPLCARNHDRIVRELAAFVENSTS